MATKHGESNQESRSKFTLCKTTNHILSISSKINNGISSSIFGKISTKLELEDIQKLFMVCFIGLKIGQWQMVRWKTKMQLFLRIISNFHIYIFAPTKHTPVDMKSHIQGTSHKNSSTDLQNLSCSSDSGQEFWLD